MPKNYSEIYASIFTNKNKMDFSNAMIRGNGIPLDATEVYNSLNAAIKYAATDPVAYEGQLLAVTENGDTNVYVIGPKSQGTVTIDGAEVANYLKLVGKETDLSNYYTKTQVEGLISSAGHLKREVVTTLPTLQEAKENVIYMIKKPSGLLMTNDYYEEYMLIDGALEKIGDTYVDLSEYVKKGELPEDQNTTYNFKAESGGNSENKALLTLSEADNAEAKESVGIKGGSNVSVTVDENKEIVITAVDSTYSAGQGLELNTGAFNVLVDNKAIILEEDEDSKTHIALQLSQDTTDEGYLSVGQDGLKISGINKAIADSKHTAGKGLALNGTAFEVKSANPNHVLVTDDGVSVGSLPVYETVEGKKTLKTAGTGIFNDVYSKEETLDKIAEKITEINGGESAGEVLGQLNSYKEVTDPRITSLEDYVKYSQDISIVEREVEIDGETTTKKAYKVNYNVNNLTQDENDYLILNCGSATVNI